jgi:hypothetical protein
LRKVFALAASDSFTAQAVEFPRMPRATGCEEEGHRQKDLEANPACIARPVKGKEIKSSPKAQAALDKEWD